MSDDEREREALANYFRALLPRRDLDSDFLDVVTSLKQKEPREFFSERTHEWRQVDGEFVYVELTEDERAATREDHGDEFEPQLEAQRQAAHDRLKAKQSAAPIGDPTFALKIRRYRKLATEVGGSKPSKQALVTALAVLAAETFRLRFDRKPYQADVKLALKQTLGSLKIKFPDDRWTRVFSTEGLQLEPAPNWYLTDMPDAERQQIESLLPSH